MLSVHVPNTGSYGKDVLLSYTGADHPTAAMGRPLLVQVRGTLDGSNYQELDTRYGYDSEYRLAWIVDPRGDQTDILRNVYGQPTDVTFPATGLTGSGRASLHAEYAYLGGPAFHSWSTDENGTTVRENYTTLGLESEVLGVTSNSAGPITYAYDGAYRLKELTNALGAKTTYAYDPVTGGLASVRYPGAAAPATLSYNLDGTLRQATDERGNITQYNYFLDGALQAVLTGPDADHLTPFVSYERDWLDRPWLVTDRQGTAFYTYNQAGGLEYYTRTYTGLPDRAIGYHYNADGSLASENTPAGDFSYGYDGLGRPVSETNPFGDTLAWQYTADGLLQGQTITPPLSSGISTSYQYTHGIPTLLQNSRVGGDVLSSFAPIYDSEFRKASVASTITGNNTYTGTSQYQYDDKGQLVREDTGRGGQPINVFRYDPAGNPTLFKGDTANYNSADQSTSVNYDASGNPQTVRGQSAVFDAQNHLVQYGSDFFAGYNSDGLRAWKDAATPAGEQKTYYLYDHGVPLCEMDAAGNVTATNTFGLTGLAARHTSAGNTYYTWDLQGNPVQRLNESGNVTSFHAFDAFGAEMTAPAGQTNTTGDPYAGMGGAYGNYTDHETGLILMGHRYYDPSQGRFINRDPIGHAGGMDVYAYCENDPVNHSDPSGLFLDDSGITTGEYPSTSPTPTMSSTDYGQLKDLERHMGVNITNTIGPGIQVPSGVPAGGYGNPAGNDIPSAAGFFPGGQSVPDTPISMPKSSGGPGGLGGFGECSLSAWYDGDDDTPGSVGQSNAPALGTEQIPIPYGVLDRKPQYTAIGREPDQKRFDFDPNVDTWRKSGPTRLPSWEQNVAWLQARVDRGDQFLMATPIDQLDPRFIWKKPNGSWTWRELMWLINHGVQVQPAY